MAYCIPDEHPHRMSDSRMLGDGSLDEYTEASGLVITFVIIEGDAVTEVGASKGTATGTAGYGRERSGEMSHRSDSRRQRVRLVLQRRQGTRNSRQTR